MQISSAVEDVGIQAHKHKR